MRNIRYDDESGLDLPKEIQLKRMLRVMERELTQIQRQVLTDYYFGELSPAQIARKRGVHRSTALRNLRRAEARLRRFLRY